MIFETGQPGRKADAAHAHVIDVDERSFQTAVMERSQEVPVVIDFWASWCAPCRQLGPTLERLAQEAQGAWVLAKIDTDQNQRLAQMFRVQGIPAVMAVYQGKVVEQFTGALPESQVRAWLKRFLPEKGGSLVDAARELEAHDPEAAISRYRLLLGDEPNHAEALLRLGRLLLLQGNPEGVETLRQVPGESPLFGRAQAMLPLLDLFATVEGEAAGESTTRFQAAATAARAAAYEAALENLLAIVARDRAFRDDGARAAFLALLAVLGDDHPLVPTYRRRLASALF
ncbi:MAG: tetratricopeptide repeat protein [Candidatus Viridilinea halotolerans]|uniref:Tetratricopeptide repeat protein n=1 Tax=Candidatus Viridilinea halotolerans TaxID=2491704 RepID=A0A426TWX8_9CHLR|nr:MAG: tetratricopeptide repeat protein [Candidatus Viridilinea halotolerans]